MSIELIKRPVLRPVFVAKSAGVDATTTVNMVMPYMPTISTDCIAIGDGIERYPSVFQGNPVKICPRRNSKMPKLAESNRILDILSFQNILANAVAQPKKIAKNAGNPKIAKGIAQ
jgi:hypothetical protein